MSFKGYKEPEQIVDKAEVTVFGEEFIAIKRIRVPELGYDPCYKYYFRLKKPVSIRKKRAYCIECNAPCYHGTYRCRKCYNKLLKEKGREAIVSPLLERQRQRRIQKALGELPEETEDTSSG